MRGVTGGLEILRQIARQHADQFEPVAQLEAQRAIADATRAHVLDIRPHIAAVALGTTREARQAASEDDALQAEVLAQPLAQLVHAPADAQAAVRRIDADFHAVEPVAGRQMPRGVAAAGDFLPAVRRHRRTLVDAERRAVAHRGIVVERDEHALRELRDLPVEHLGGIAVVAPVDTLAERDDRRDVGDAGMAQRQPRPLARGRFGHAGDLSF